jgi:adenylate cyclase
LKRATLCALLSIFLWQASPEQIIEGTLDLSSHDFASVGAVHLDGTWAFYPDELLTGAETIVGDNSERRYTVPVPTNWSNYAIDGEPFPKYGSGTFILTVRLPETEAMYGLRIPAQGSSFAAFVDGKPIASSGTPSTDTARYLPSDRPETVYFPAAGTIRLAVQISNYSYARGGFRYSVTLGTERHIEFLQNRAVAFDFFLLGSLLILIIYHLAMYLMRRQDRAPLYFSLFCLCMLVYVSAQGERSIYALFPHLPWELKKKIGYLPHYGAIPLLILHVNAVFKGIFDRRVLRAMLAYSAAFAASVLLTGAATFSSFTSYLEAGLVLLGFGATLSLIKLRKYKLSDTLIFLFGFAAILLAGINDTLMHNQIVGSVQILPIGTFLFISSQSLLLSKTLTDSFRKSERLRDSYQRFVPEGFLTMMNRPSITSIKLGDHVEGEMSIMFCDIRDFTSLSENMTPKENFDFINSFLKQIAVSITENDGFVDKFIGDEIMALFPKKPADAVNAAVSLQRNLGRFNEERAANGLPAVRVGIGLHVGQMMLGTIGEHHRMDFTVISDAVNTASRLQELTKVFDARILASTQLLSKLESTDAYFSRFLGKIMVKGKKKWIAVSELSVDESGEVPDIRRRTSMNFEKAILAYLDREFDTAADAFAAVLALDPSDKVSEFYLARALECQANGVGDDWDGVVDSRG